MTDLLNILGVRDAEAFWFRQIRTYDTPDGWLQEKAWNGRICSCN